MKYKSGGGLRKVCLKYNFISGGVQIFHQLVTWAREQLLQRRVHDRQMIYSQIPDNLKLIAS